MTIGNSAFYDTKLLSVDIPSSVTAIGENAFAFCDSLTAATFHAGLLSLGTGAFMDTGLLSVDIPSSITAIGESAFAFCDSLTAATLHGGLLSIGKAAFMDTGLLSVDIPSSVTAIGESAFAYCDSLTAVTFHEGLLSLGAGAFYDSGLISVDLPFSVTKVEPNTFAACGYLERIVIRNSGAYLDASAFADSNLLADGVYGIDDSTAETFAANNAFPFHLIYTVQFEAGDGSGVPDSFFLTGELFTPPTPPIRAGYVFIGWYLEEACTNGVNHLTPVTDDMTLYAKWEVLSLTPSALGGQIAVGGRITLTPNSGGGEWSFDPAFLSRDGDTFTALKKGATRVTYTVGQETTHIDLTIKKAALPITGQDFTPVFAFFGAAILLGFAGLAFTKKGRAQKGVSKE